MSERRRPHRGSGRRGDHRDAKGSGGVPVDPKDQSHPDDLTEPDDLTDLADVTVDGGTDYEPDEPADRDEPGSVGRKPRRGAEASRRARGVSGLRLLLLTVGAIVVVIALTAVAYFSPLMSVRTIEVTGNSIVQSPEIVAAAALSKGEPLMQVDTAAAAQRVSMIPRVATVRVKREYPSTITVSVVERQPVVYTERDGKRYLMDKLGFEFAQQDPPPGLAELVTSNPGSGDPSTRAALSVMTGVPAYVADQVARIEVTSPVNIVLQLKDNRTVVWGDDERNGEKAETLRHVLGQEGTEYNVSSPQNPTFK
ncbi:MAG: cell division protein FtsQ [Gordonia sp. (in: high G+C Gram-positive bacteria)]|nr:MAG: cell division protein FtsQ [Gordonia sp. (in: high G+C Gram-positive bacteria)]